MDMSGIIGDISICSTSDNPFKNKLAIIKWTYAYVIVSVNISTGIEFLSW